MMRHWILGGTIVLAVVLLPLFLYAYISRPKNGDHTHPPKVFHEDYTGEEFSYPATWKEDKGEFGFAGYKGARGCGFWVFLGTADLKALEPALIQANPHSVFAPAPPWAGPERSVAGFQVTTDFGHGKRSTEFRNYFETRDDKEEVDETMQPGDDACRSDLNMIESTYHMLRPTGR